MRNYRIGATSFFLFRVTFFVSVPCLANCLSLLSIGLYNFKQSHIDFGSNRNDSCVTFVYASDKTNKKETRIPNSIARFRINGNGMKKTSILNNRFGVELQIQIYVEMMGSRWKKDSISIANAKIELFVVDIHLLFYDLKSEISSSSSSQFHRTSIFSNFPFVNTNSTQKI